MKTILPLLASLALFLGGCQTSPVAQALAKEQLAVLESAQKANEAYAGVVIQFATAAGVTAKAEARRDYETRKKLLVTANSAQPETLAKEIETAKGDFDAELARIDADVEILKAKSAELGKVWPSLIAGQEELRRYLATQRIDQKLAAEVSAYLKVDQAKLESTTSSLLDKIANVTKK